MSERSDTVAVMEVLSVLFLATSIAGLLGVLASPLALPHPALPPGRTFFRSHVVPVLDRRCGGCHGLEEGPASELRESAKLRWSVDGAGRLRDPERAYQRCLSEVDRGGPALASPIVRAGLARAYSGGHHPEVFSGPEDEDLQALVSWVQLEATDASSPTSSAAAFFAAEVVPVLERKTCFGVSCHGAQAFNDLRLDGGMPGLPERFTPTMQARNRRAMLGDVTRLVHLSGDVERSRQLLKIIPVEQGGILHKGGNDFLERGDPDYRTLKRWLELEAAEAIARTGLEVGKSQGLVFVRRPRQTPERFFEDGEFHPGGDLIWLRDGGEVNLTAGLHPDGPADIRAPDVRYDARRVVFSMRRSIREPFDLWEVDLETRAARQLTFSEDPDVHFLDPLYVPDPDEGLEDRLDKVCVVAVSNRAGGVCASSPDGRLGEAEGGTERELRDAQLFERAGTYTGRRLEILRGTNAGETRRILRQDIGRLLVESPFPRPCDSTTHYRIEDPARMAPRYDAYRLRYAPEGKEREHFHEHLDQMTYSVSQVRRPAMRSSGEVLFTCLRTGWQSGRPFFNGALFRTHVDGSNFHTHNGNRSGVPIHAADRELPDGLEVRIGQSADSYWGGMLMLSEHQFGPTIEPDNPLDDLDHPYGQGPPPSSLPRFLPGWISLDPTVTFAGVSPGGAYRDPYPMPDGSLLVSFAPGPLDLHDPEVAPDFDVLRLVPDPAFQSSDGHGPGRFRREVLLRGPEAELWARPVVARLKEPVRKRLKADEWLLGAPGMVNGFAGYPEGTPGTLLVNDQILLDAFFEQVTPLGPRHLALPVCPTCGEQTPELDQVHYLRIVGADPLVPGEVGAPRRRILAELPLEGDGSAYVTLPSGTSFDLQSLNAHRMALRQPNRWLYCRPGERHALSTPRTLFTQTCGGCHGGLSGAPAESRSQLDAVTSASRTLASWDAAGARRRRPANHPATGGAVETLTVDFQRHVRPLLERRCVGCHTGGPLDLSGEAAFQSLRSVVEHREGLAIRSYLIEKLMGRELHAPRSLEGDTPHALPEEELRTLIRWIDLGARRGKGARP